MSSENPKRPSILLKFPKNNDCVECLNLNSDMKEMQRFKLKLLNAIQNNRDITTKLHEVVIDKKETRKHFKFLC